MPKKILVVDDEEDLQTLVKSILENAGFAAASVGSGQECLDRLKKEKFDLVILDMMMPGMSGRETCEKIRKNPDTKSTKVIFLTVARFSEAGKGTLTDLKVLDYVTKPFENDDLIKRVKKAISK
jgi:two-component system phosphate regulon response regulator PhoB